MRIYIIVLLVGVWGQWFVLGQGGERVEDDDELIRDIEEEIIKLVRSTKESRRKENVRSYEKIFLRLAATGAQALARNMLYASTQTVFQGDDDEENDENDDDEKRSMRDNIVYHIENLLDDSELEGTGRSQFVPQILGEPLYYVPASYWLQVFFILRSVALMQIFIIPYLVNSYCTLYNMHFLVNFPGVYLCYQLWPQKAWKIFRTRHAWMV